MIAVRSLDMLFPTIFDAVENGIENNGVIVRGEINIIYGCNTNRDTIEDYIRSNAQTMVGKIIDNKVYSDNQLKSIEISLKRNNVAPSMVLVEKSITLVPLLNININFMSFDEIQEDGVYIIYDPDNKFINCDMATKIEANIFHGFENYIQIKKSYRILNCCICEDSYDPKSICWGCLYGCTNLDCLYEFTDDINERTMISILREINGKASTTNNRPSILNIKKTEVIDTKYKVAYW